MRIDGRTFDELRRVDITPDFTLYADGSVLYRAGNTVVLCNASLEDKVPPHVTEGGWITAEYSMLPRANRQRSPREISVMKKSPRSTEIQRLIGRSLRSAFFLKDLGEHTITVDCDVLQGDGGTRTASITGGFLAVMFACHKMVEEGKLPRIPLRSYTAAISAGIIGGVPMLDLCYEEDSSADVDFNCVMNEKGELLEIQGTGEGRPFTMEEEEKLLSLCRKGIQSLIQEEKRIFALWSNKESKDNL